MAGFRRDGVPKQERRRKPIKDRDSICFPSDDARARNARHGVSLFSGSRLVLACLPAWELRACVPLAADMYAHLFCHWL